MTDAYYRWVIVAAGAAMGCVGAGSMFSLPVLMRAIVEDTGWSVAGVSSTMTIGFIAMAFGSIAWGALSDRFGPRLVAVTGSVIIAVSLALASQLTSLLAFQLVFGLLVGGAMAAIFIPTMTAVTGWFDTNRALAVSLVSVGIGVAPMTMAPLAAWLVSNHHWRTSLLVLAAMAALIMIPAALLMRSPPVAPSNSADPDAPPDMPVAQALRSPQFVILLLTNFFCCATHSGPIIHTVNYAVTCGIPLIAAVSIYSLEGLAGLGGRVAFGLMGDRFGAKRILVLGLLAQAFGALAYAFVRDLGAFYSAAAAFGFIYGGVMPLYAVIARENFPARMMGTVIGGTAMAGSFGMATGPIAGGLVYDALGSYSWLFVGSWILGLCAFGVALTFRPFPKEEPAPVAA